MLLLGIFAFTAIASGILYLASDMFEDWWTAKRVRDISSTVCVVASAFLLALLLLFVFSRFHLASYEAQHEAMQETIENARTQDMTDSERMSLTNSIVEQNKDLAEEQYWADTYWLNVFYTDSFRELEPIE